MVGFQGCLDFRFIVSLDIADGLAMIEVHANQCLYSWTGYFSFNDLVYPAIPEEDVVLHEIPLGNCITPAFGTGPWSCYKISGIRRKYNEKEIRINTKIFIAQWPKNLQSMNAALIPNRHTFVFYDKIADDYHFHFHFFFSSFILVTFLYNR